MNASARSGKINRVAAVLLALICVMLVLIAIPILRDYRYRAGKVACDQAMASARDGLILEYLKTWDEGSAQQAMVTLDQVMPGRDDLCPSGGVVYLIRREDGVFEPVCGLHDSDERRRVRLNASRALELFRQAFSYAKPADGASLDAVGIELNGKALSCARVEAEEKDLRRGTGSTTGYEGTVAFFGVAGEGDFSTQGAKRGEICYFIYADENHCAIWRAGDGWSGDAYQ